MIEAMKQMVEALQHIEKCEGLTQQGHKAIQTGIQAIAEAEKQEPVAIDNQDLTIAYMSGVHDERARQKRKPLTEEAIATVYWGATGQSLRPQDNALAHKFARAIEAAHNIKEES